MGQYYRAVNITKGEYLVPWDYDNGAKLMEHSYIQNRFVLAVENLLTLSAKWAGDQIVWAGDYMDPGIHLGNFVKPSLVEEISASKGDSLTLYNGSLTLYNLSEDFIKLDKVPALKTDNLYPYILNESKKEFVKKGKYGSSDDDLIIHPLPILVSSGNGRGGGDYWGSSESLVGSWAGDRITVSASVPEGFTEITPNFKEER